MTTSRVRALRPLLLAGLVVCASRALVSQSASGERANASAAQPATADRAATATGADTSTVALYAAAQAARRHADSLGVFVADWRTAIRRLPRDTVRLGGAAVAVWQPWSAAARVALSAASDSMRAIVGTTAPLALSELHVDITPMLARDGTPLVNRGRSGGDLPVRVEMTGERFAQLPPLRGAVNDTSLTRFLVDAMTRIVSARHMDTALRRWIDEEPSLVVPPAEERKRMYRQTVGRAVGISTRQCVLGWLQQCPRVFGLRGNTGDALPFQRALLLRHALILGGEGAFARLTRDTTQAIADRLSAAAGQPAPAIIAAWHADVVQRWRPDAPHVPARAIASTLLCGGMLGFLLVRSRR